MSLDLKALGIALFGPSSSQKDRRRRAFKPSPEERFWIKVDFDGPIPEACPELGPCWIWTANKSAGYGLFAIAHNFVIVAHKVAYLLLIGSYDEKLDLDHLCYVRACVNPYHLEPVTQLENAKRRGLHQTHCANGHLRTDENTYFSGGKRWCKPCQLQRKRDRYRNSKKQ